jgi:hypothetical protein
VLSAWLAESFRFNVGRAQGGLLLTQSSVETQTRQIRAMALIRHQMPLNMRCGNLDPNNGLAQIWPGRTASIFHWQL